MRTRRQFEAELTACRPRALLSDFGSATDRSSVRHRARTGATGTACYLSPEAQLDVRTGRLRELSTAADLWALGLLLHELCFLALPWRQLNDADLLRDEIQSYAGFDAAHDHGRVDLPLWLLRLISRLLSPDPAARPSAAECLAQLDRLASPMLPSEGGALVRHPSPAVVPVPGKEPALPESPRWPPTAFAAFVGLKVRCMPVSWVYNDARQLLVLRPSRLSLLYALFCAGLAEVAMCVSLQISQMRPLTAAAPRLVCPSPCPCSKFASRWPRRLHSVLCEAWAYRAAASPCPCRDPVPWAAFFRRLPNRFRTEKSALAGIQHPRLVAHRARCPPRPHSAMTDAVARSRALGVPDERELGPIFNTKLPPTAVPGGSSKWTVFRDSLKRAKRECGAMWCTKSEGLMACSRCHLVACAPLRHPYGSR